MRRRCLDEAQAIYFQARTNPLRSYDEVIRLLAAEQGQAADRADALRILDGDSVVLSRITAGPRIFGTSGAGYEFCPSGRRPFTRKPTATPV